MNSHLHWRIVLSVAQPALLGVLPLVLLAASGCGNQGPTRYRVSGTVTYNGQPVPGGEITFSPDPSQGNGGPGSFALIKKGKFETFRDKGAVSGPHRVSISGYNAMPGEIPDDQIRELFPIYQTTIDLPAEEFSYDFVVPANN